jgi:hypothetical protein
VALVESTVLNLTVEKANPIQLAAAEIKVLPKTPSDVCPTADFLYVGDWRLMLPNYGDIW